MSDRRHLRLRDKESEPIDRPWAMFLAATVETEPDDIEMLYQTMLKDDEIKGHGKDSGYTRTGKVTFERQISGDTKNRLYAAQVVLEMKRFQTAKNATPSLKMARDLVAYGQAAHDGRPNSKNNVDTVREADSNYRNILHFLAANLLAAPFDDEENYPPPTFAYVMGLSKGFELLLDGVAIANRMKWNPIRVPEEFPPITDIKFSQEALDQPFFPPEDFY